jgi:tRNA (guanine-N7-)-methyltransferase
MQPATAEILSPQQSLILPLTSILERLDLSALFQPSQPLEVELGSGDGSFLVAYAAANRDRSFLGIERLLGRIRKLDKKGRRLGLTNLGVLRIECSYLVEYLLPRESVSAIHIYFPDPWPKRKHRRNRLVNERFPAIAQAALIPSGRVYLRTDDQDYFQQMLRVFSGSPLFEPMETPESLSSVQTDFERGFLAKGIPTLRAAYQRKAIEKAG